MAKGGLAIEVRNALIRAKKDPSIVRKRAIEFKTANGNGDPASAKESAALVDIEVVPIIIGNVQEVYYMVVFLETSPSTQKPSRSASAASAIRCAFSPFRMRKATWPAW